MMADATHTQGPWTVKFQESRWDTTQYTDKYWHDQWVIKGPDKKHSPVATVRVAGYGMGPSMAVRKANAILIAAAPDLLEALETMLALFADHAQYDEEGHETAAIVAAQVAITKATGADQ